MVKPATPSEIAPAFYTVQSGDTLWGISLRHGLDVNAVAKLNHLDHQGRHWLRIGQRIRLRQDLQGDPAHVSISLVDAVSHPLSDAEVRIRAAEHIWHTRTDSNGICPTVLVEQPSTGFQVELHSLHLSWETIYICHALPPGFHTLQLSSGDVLVKYRLQPDTGVTQVTPAVVKQAFLDSRHKSEAPAVASSQTLISKALHPPPDSPKDFPAPVRMDLRETSGTAATTLALYQAAGGLKLDPGNAAWHGHVVQAAQRHGLAPWYLATVLHIESPKRTRRYSTQDVNGKPVSAIQTCWNMDHGDPDSDAAVGVGQIQYPALLDIAQQETSLLNQHLRKRYQAQSIRHDIKRGAPAGRRVLFTEAGLEIHERDYKPLRKHPDFAFDCCATYLAYVLQKARSKSWFDQVYKTLNITEQWMVAYALYNLGPVAAIDMLNVRWGDVDRWRSGLSASARAQTESQQLQLFCQNFSLRAEERSLLSVTWPLRFDMRAFMVDPSGLPTASIFRILRSFYQTKVAAPSIAQTRQKVTPGLSPRQEIKSPNITEKVVTPKTHVTKQPALRDQRGESADKSARVIPSDSKALQRHHPNPKRQSGSSDDLEKTKPKPVTITTILRRNPGVNWDSEAPMHPQRVYSPPLNTPLRLRTRSPSGDFPIIKSAVGLERVNGKQPRWHTGLDFAANPGDLVLNPFHGVVRRLGYDKNGFGHYLRLGYQTNDLPSAPRAYLQHLGLDEFDLLFAHLDPSVVGEFPSLSGRYLKAGTVLAKAGFSGNAHDMRTEASGMHLHLEARLGDFVFDPLPLFPPTQVRGACRVYRFNAHHFNQTYEPYVCPVKGCAGCSISGRFTDRYVPLKHLDFLTEVPPQMMKEAPQHA